MCRRCGEPDRRGSAEDRRRRRSRMLSEYGNGVVCPCWWCGTLLGVRRGYLTTPAGRLAIHRLEQDRLIPGGSYAYDNVVPACRSCNHARAVDQQQWADGCDFGGALRRPLWAAA